MSKKILLADDSVTIQKVISITFSSEDYELVIVGDGDAAIKKAKEESPDLVLADVAMPGKNGYEVAEALKNDSATAAIPVMLLAGTFEPLDQSEAERVRVDDSIVKPFESQELLDKVRVLLAKSSTVTSGGAAAAKAGLESALSEDIWEEGDFTGFTDEPEFKEKEAPDLSFLEDRTFEESGKELSSPNDDFTDLEFHEDDFKMNSESAAAPAHEEKEEEKKEAPYEPPTSDNFDILEPFDFKTDETKLDIFDIPSFEIEHTSAQREPEAAEAVPEPAPEPSAEEKAPKRPFWAESGREPEGQSASEAVPEPIEATQETADVVDFVEPSEEEKPLFNRSAKESAAAPSAGVDEAVANAVEKALGRVEERLNSALAARAAEQAEQAVAAAISRLEERFKDDVASRLKGVESDTAAAIEKAAAKVEESLREGIGERLEKSVELPKDQVEEIVRKTAKDVIEEVAWEVIPALAEELIKSEIARVKEAILRVK